MASSFLTFLYHTQRRTTVGRTPLDEWSAPLPDNTRHSQQTNIHAPGGIRTHDLSRRAATDLRLRPRGHWDRRLSQVLFTKILRPCLAQDLYWLSERVMNEFPTANIHILYRRRHAAKNQPGYCFHRKTPNHLLPPKPVFTHWGKSFKALEY